MMRFFISFFLFLILAAGELAFLNSLPAPFFYIPLIFACSLYLFQHLGSNIGLWWLLALGVYLDFWHLGLFFGETLVYTLTILFVVFLGQRLFTNRSFYGVLGNAVLSLWFLHFINFSWFFLKNLNEDFYFSWWSVMFFVFWQTVFLILLVTILFFLARRLQFFLKHLLIMPGQENL